MKTIQSNSSNGKSALLSPLGLVGAVAALVLLCVPVHAAQTASLGWDASPSVGVAGYTVYRGTKSGVYTNSYDAGTNLALTLTGLTEGQTNYFQVVAYDPARMAGTPSTELSFIVPGVMRFAAPSQAGNPATVSFPVATGHTYQIQASTNLSAWTTIYTTTSATSNAWVTYQDPQTSAFPKRFYRLILN